MILRAILLDAVVRNFGDRAMRVGTSADEVSPAAYGDLIVRFPAAHPAVGDASVRGEGTDSNESVCSAAVSVGDIVVQYSFNNFDNHLAADERGARVAGDVVRFLRELFADRLLLWKSADGLNAAWRERGDAGHLEPLVIDDRTYDRYLWSRPLPPWRASAAILAKGGIADDRDYQVILWRLNKSAPDGFVGSEDALARRLVADYERGQGV
jgi:hypothetical protein